MADAAGRESQTPPVPAPHRRRSPSAIAVVIVWVLVLLIGAAGATYRWTTGYRRLVNKSLGPDVRHVEVQPSPGAAPVRVARPADLAALRTALALAARRPPAGAGVSGADCTVRIVYGEGRDVRLMIGRTDVMPGGPAAPNGVVEIRWGAYTRYASRDALRRLLVPSANEPGASTTPVTQPSR